MDDSPRDKQSILLPHEWCFGAFLAITWLRLLLTGGRAANWSWVFAGLIIGSLAVIRWAKANPSGLSWRVRLLYYPAAMGVSFYAMEYAVPLLGVPKADAMLLAWDRALIGETPALVLEKFQNPWIADISMAGYLFFFVYLVGGPGRYCIRDLSLFRKCIVGLFTLYGLSFLGYTFVPAGGPHRFMTFSTPLDGFWLLDKTLKSVNEGSNCVDVFPSVHLAATLYLLVFDWWHARKRFWWTLVPCLVLWFSTVYLRFHYFVDLLAGAAVAVAGLAVAHWYAKTSVDEEEPELVLADTATRKELEPVAAELPVD